MVAAGLEKKKGGRKERRKRGTDSEKEDVREGGR